MQELRLLRCGLLVGPVLLCVFVRGSPREDLAGWRVPAFRRWAVLIFTPLLFSWATRLGICKNGARTMDNRRWHYRSMRLGARAQRALPAFWPARPSSCSIEAHVDSTNAHIPWGLLRKLSPRSAYTSSSVGVWCCAGWDEFLL